MVRIERQDHIDAAVRQMRIGLGALDQRHVGEVVLPGMLAGGVQEIGENIFRHHMARRSHGPAQIRQHVADACADIRHGHAWLEGHRIHQFLWPFGGIASGAGQARRHRFAAFGGLIARVGFGGHLRPEGRAAQSQ